MSQMMAASNGLRRPRVAAALLVVSLLSLLAVFVQRSSADLRDPPAADRQIARAISVLLPKEHLTRHELNDEISHRWLAQFLKTLDPMKVYFLQTDVDEFMRQRNNLDDMAKSGDLRFAYKVFNLFLKRIDERVALVDELLAEKHDFSLDEDIVTDPDLTKYAKNDADIRDAWRRRIKYDLLVLKSDKEKIVGEAAREKLTRRYHSFGKRMRQTDGDELLEMYLSALSTSYDPHTTYMSDSTLKNFDIVMKLKLEGIGAALQFTDGYTVVSKVIPGGAADKDGRLKPEDKVVGVGEGEEGEMVDVVDMKLNDVVKRIRGNRGTVVRLQVVPTGQTARKIYNITRAEIKLTDSEARSQIFEEGKKPGGTPYKVGVINLPSFYMDMSGARDGQDDYKSTTRDVAKLLEDFNRKNVDVVILDLRHNGGGSLTESISLTGLFLDRGPIVQVKDADGKIQHYDDPERGMAWAGPLVVLTNKFSASASEIFAGAIQDYRRGLIIGDTSTHGKGTVQSLLDLGQRLFRINNAPALGALKITMQQFYRPNGDSTQNRGVLADIELPSLTSQYDVGESSLDYAMKFDHIDPVPYRKAGLVDTRMVEQLKTQSAERRKSSSEFDKVLRKIARYNEQKQRKRVSLNETKFMADRAELNTEQEEEKEFEEMNDPNRPVVKRDYYFNEALAITLDYMRMINAPQAAVIGKR